MVNKVLHFAGIPGAGKTTYCRWLEREKGFKHFEFDRLLQGRGSAADLAIIAHIDEPAKLFPLLMALNKPCILDWGFRPYHDFNRVKAVIEAGAETWWFTADIEDVRKAFLLRGDVSEEAFDSQMSQIDSRWPEMSKLFEPRIIESLKSGGVHVEPHELFKMMFEPI